MFSRRRCLDLNPRTTGISIGNGHCQPSLDELISQEITSTFIGNNPKINPLRVGLTRQFCCNLNVVTGELEVGLLSRRVLCVCIASQTGVDRLTLHGETDPVPRRYAGSCRLKRTD
jgi:hypothetical protein